MNLSSFIKRLKNDKDPHQHQQHHLIMQTLLNIDNIQNYNLVYPCVIPRYKDTNLEIRVIWHN